MFVKISHFLIFAMLLTHVGADEPDEKAVCAKIIHSVFLKTEVLRGTAGQDEDVTTLAFLILALNNRGYWMRGNENSRVIKEGVNAICSKINKEYRWSHDESINMICIWMLLENDKFGLPHDLKHILKKSLLSLLSRLENSESKKEAKLYYTMRLIKLSSEHLVEGKIGDRINNYLFSFKKEIPTFKYKASLFVELVKRKADKHAGKTAVLEKKEANLRMLNPLLVPFSNDLIELSLMDMIESQKWWCSW